MRPLLSAFWALLLVLGFTAVSRQPHLDHRPSYGSLPVAFEANAGQSPPEVKFVARAPGHTLFLTEQEARLTLRRGSLRRSIAMRLEGSRAPRAIAASGELPGRSHYLRGHDSRQWRTGIPNYSRVTYQGVYPGVDAVFHDNQQRLEYDFVVAPGADPAQIRLRFEGVDRIARDASGALLLHAGDLVVRQERPETYQTISGVRRRVDSDFVLNADQTVTFAVGPYDRGQTLVIDPVIVYSSYLGGTRSETALAVAVDSNGSAYVAGVLDSTDYPTFAAMQGAHAGDYECFVTKLNLSGTARVYSTYLGGSGFDQCSAITVDASHSLYLTGYTRSANFPVVDAIQPAYAGNTDAFLAQLNPQGNSLVFSTYLGASSGDVGAGITRDAAGNIYVTGTTASSGFPVSASAQQRTFGGQQDIFWTKFDAAGTLVYSTFYGGFNNEEGGKIAVDAGGNVHIVGTCADGLNSLNQVQNGYGGGTSDACLARFGPTGALLYASYLGGSGTDTAGGVALDSQGNAWYAITTEATGLPTTPAAIRSTGAGGGDVYVLHLFSTGIRIQATYLGGSGADAVADARLDSSGYLCLAGTTNSADFLLADPLQPLNRGLNDLWAARLRTTSSGLEFASYLGGSGDDFARGLAVDAGGAMYIAGFTVSSDFPTSSGAAQTAFAGGIQDGFVVKIGQTNPQVPANGVVGGADFRAFVAGGGIGSLFGSNLAPGVGTAATLPLPTTLRGTSVTLSGIACPLFYVSPGQINFQIPWELLSATQATLVVATSGGSSAPLTVGLQRNAPGVFSSGASRGAVLIANSDILAQTAGSVAGRISRPASRGEFITVFFTGGGAVSGQPPTGHPASPSPLSSATAATSVTIGGVTTPASFSGLAPLFVGLYQANVRVPDSVAPGAAVNVSLNVGGAVSNTVTIAVQ